MARILITIEGKTRLRVAAAYVRGTELDAGQVEAIEESAELVALVGLLQRVAPRELDWWGPLEQPAPGEPSVPEKYNVALHELVVKSGTEFRRLAEAATKENRATGAHYYNELADDCETLTEAARYVSERANDEAQADESEAE